MKRVSANISIELLSTGTALLRGNIAKEKRGDVTTYRNADKEFNKHDDPEKNKKEAIAFAKKHQAEVLATLD